MGEWVDFGALKQAVTLQSVLEHYGVAGLRRRRDQLEGRCPIHRGQRDDSFRANLRKNVFHCFSCQAQGNVLDFVAAMERSSIREAACRLQRWWGTRAGVEGATRWREVERRSELVREKAGCNPPLGFKLTGVDPGHGYLREREIDRATAVAFGVGFYGGPGVMSGRLVIPIGNVQGQIVAYAGRAVDGGLPKYKLPTGFRKGWELFNLHRAAATSSQSVIVVEGYFDCLKIHQSGFPYVVALMGSSLSASQQKILTGHFGQVLVMLDGDEAGRAGSRAICAKLSGVCTVTIARVPQGAQPDQLSPNRIREIVAQGR